MKPHVKIYLKSRGLTGHEYIPCEACGARGVQDVHHLVNRGIGGNRELDCVGNLIGLCRPCHERAHRDKAFNEQLKQRVKERLNVSQTGTSNREKVKKGE